MRTIGSLMPGEAFTIVWGDEVAASVHVPYAPRYMLTTAHAGTLVGIVGLDTEHKGTLFYVNKDIEINDNLPDPFIPGEPGVV